MVKNLPAMLESRVQSLGQEDPLEKEMATHSKELDMTEWLTHRDVGKEEMSTVRRVLSATEVTGKLPKALGDEEARTQVSPAWSDRLDGRSTAGAYAEGQAFGGTLIKVQLTLECLIFCNFPLCFPT